MHMIFWRTCLDDTPQCIIPGVRGCVGVPPWCIHLLECWSEVALHLFGVQDQIERYISAFLVCVMSCLLILFFEGRNEHHMLAAGRISLWQFSLIVSNMSLVKVLFCQVLTNLVLHVLAGYTFISPNSSLQYIRHKFFRLCQLIVERYLFNLDQLLV